MLDELLRYGYFPGELPPLFTTASFADAIKTSPSSLPALMTEPKAKWTRPTYHNLARVGGLRRRLAVPNPVNFYRISKSFDSHSALLTARWGLSPFSQTTPILTSAGPRALLKINSNRSLSRASIRVGSRYLLRTDIAQFYPSIYTHSIPWALHTKAVAKANINNPALAGNQIDKEVQAGNQGQTKGIPIGPDTSLGISELILAPIDQEFRAACKMLGGVRFIDDMEFSFVNLADAENALTWLEGKLHEFELQLNGSKTQIIELPDSIESPFVSGLRARIPEGSTRSRAAWIDFFNNAFILAKSNPTEGVLRYAVAVLTGIPIHPNVWGIAQSLLWQCISLDPGCLRFVIDVLWMNTRALATHKLDIGMASEALASLILASAPVGHGSEVVWALWTSMLYDIKLSTQATDAISKMDDSFVAVAAHVAEAQGLLNGPLSSMEWEGWIEPESFYEKHWLFVYEAFRNGWMSAKITGTRIGANAACAFLRTNQVAFVDELKIKTYRPNKLANIGGGGGGY